MYTLYHVNTFQVSCIKNLVFYFDMIFHDNDAISLVVYNQPFVAYSMQGQDFKVNHLIVALMHHIIWFLSKVTSWLLFTLQNPYMCKFWLWGFQAMPCFFNSFMYNFKMYASSPCSSKFGYYLLSFCKISKAMLEAFLTNSSLRITLIRLVTCI